uniref:Uncharacterized protein n=1 Tax=Physcomitrium patens TaxID=3218 RepID=A0A2K1IU51_PHYPA|nr:hypothetical protein PHYPA_024746 [Physcomitrium patens]
MTSSIVEKASVRNCVVRKILLKPRSCAQIWEEVWCVSVSDSRSKSALQDRVALHQKLDEWALLWLLLWQCRSRMLVIGFLRLVASVP